MNLRATVKSLTPPALLPLLRRFSGGSLRFDGRPRDWQDGLRQSTGYAARQIVERAAAATREVVAGRAAFERDSVLFDQPDYPFPVVAALLRAAALNRGHLEVVDFGGSLGSLYRQCRPLLAGLASLRWQVVEQPGFVAAGRAEFTTDELVFASSLFELATPAVPPLLLAACVLQYLEDPGTALREFLSIDPAALVIDRVPLCDATGDRLCIQQVPRQIYDASYPCWIFSRRRFLGWLQDAWTVLCEYPCAEGTCATYDGLRFQFRGLILERRR